LADWSGLIVEPGTASYFAPGQLEFITSSVYWRMKLFGGPRPASSPRTTDAPIHRGASRRFQGLLRDMNFPP
jgi:hypothetical protein